MLMNDDISEPSSPEPTFDDADLMVGMTDDVTAQLVHAGPIGVAAAAAIATGKKRKRPHSFETNPSIRRRQQTRLMRKLRATIDEYTTRVGQQAVVICCVPGKGDKTFKVSGSCPLEGVIRNCRTVIMQDLEASLAQQAPAPPPENTNLHELPPLVIDGIPTPVDKMTQAQLRGFIPLMLKYSTGRGKPGWGKETCRPVWWPSDLPWANVRSDVRTEDEKRKVSWTHALRTIVKNCYKHHGREDLLPDFHDAEPHQHHQAAHQLIPSHTVVQTINNADGTLSLIQVDTGNTVATLTDVSQVQQIQHVQQLGQVQHLSHLPHVQQVLIHQSSFQPHTHLGGSQQTEATQAVQTLAEVAAATQNGTPVSIQMNGDGGHTVATLTEATLSDGQIMLSADATQSIVIPASMYPVSSLNSGQMQLQHHPQTIQTTATIDANSLNIQAETVQQVQNHANVPVASQAVEIVTLQEASIEQ